MRIIFNSRQIMESSNEDFVVSIFNEESFITRVHLKYTMNLSYVDLKDYLPELKFRIGNYCPNKAGISAIALKNSRNIRRLVFDGLTEDMLIEENSCILEKEYYKLSWTDNVQDTLDSYEDVLISTEETFRMRDCDLMHELCIDQLASDVEELYIKLKKDHLHAGIVLSVVAFKKAGLLVWADDNFNKYKKVSY